MKRSSILEYIMPAYAVHNTLGSYMGTIIPQDECARVYTLLNPTMMLFDYGNDDQGVVIQDLVKKIINHEI